MDNALHNKEYILYTFKENLVMAKNIMTPQVD